MSELRVCASCAAADVQFLQCSRCKSVLYCNKDCQKAHWKAHKQPCARIAKGDTPSEAKADESFKAGDQDKRPFHAIASNVFLHDRAEEKTFQLLIDLIRMRQEDEYALDGELMAGTIYNQEATSAKAFRTFIRKAKAVPGLLPPWWKKESVDECIKYSRNSADFSLAHAQEKHDIQEAWGDNLMPMKLRMVAERVYGNTPGGFKSEGMMAMMTQQENGGDGNFHSHLDIVGLFKGFTI